MKKIGSLLLLLMVAFGSTWATATNIVTNPRFARKALLAPDCMVNSLMNVVTVGSGSTDLGNLLDDNLENYATLKGVASLTQPIIQIKDRQNQYPAGTVAGFSIQHVASLLQVAVLSDVKIGFYLNGVLKEQKPVDQAGGSALSLGLMQVGTSSTTVIINFTATSSVSFDEVALFIGGASASLASEMKMRYAFVGDDNTTPLLSSNTTGITATGDADITNKGFLIDDNLTNYATDPAQLILDNGANITLTWTNEFAQGTAIGFRFTDAVPLNLASSISIRLTNASGTISNTTVLNTSVLGLGLLGSNTYNVAIQATQAFRKAELIIGGLSVSVGERRIYYGYVQPALTAPHQHNLGLSLNTAICPEETSYQLTATESVTWTLLSRPTGDNTATVNPSTGEVTNMVPGITGDYTFQATATDSHTGTVTLTKGITNSIDPACKQGIPDEMLLSTTVHDGSGSILDTQNLLNPQNIIDASLRTYAQYTGGVTLAGNLQIVGVQKKSNSPLWSSGTGSRIGFVVEASQGLLAADVMALYKIRLYNNTTNQYVHEAAIHSQVIAAGVNGTDPIRMVRFSIDVQAGVSFDEITLWKSGTAQVTLTTLRIYGAFIQDASLSCYSDDPLGCGSSLISTDTTGAYINYNATGISSLAAVGTTLGELEYLVDNDLTTYTTISGTSIGSTVSLAVMLGRTLNNTHQIGLVIDSPTNLADLILSDKLQVETFYKGTSTGDVHTDWAILGLNVIQYDSKTYLMLSPTQPFDEVRITMTALLSALGTDRIYGLFFRNDGDGDGVPNCIDESSCAGDNTYLSELTITSHICQNTSLTLTGTGPANQSYTLSCLVQGVADKAVAVGADGSFSWSFGPMPQYGHYSLLIKDAAGREVSTPLFSVHPLVTTWKQQSIDTDWNNWNNWTNGSPLRCTDVIIPTSSQFYPILTTLANNECDSIHFEMGGEVVKTHLLTYTAASVDLTLAADRYYMLSAPLQSMVTGDMFIPTGGNTDVFTVMTAANAPQNRFNPRIYQRLWATNARGQSLTNGNITIQPDETRWTPPFNALNQVHGLGKGFSLKADRGTVPTATPLTFRFPKTHTEYTYVTEANQPTTITETITRSNGGRFIYEAQEGNLFPLTVTLTNQSAGKVFLAGNPFMTHLDIAQLLQANSAITSIKVYDGNSSNSVINADGELLSSGMGYTAIAPMQSFFITVTNDATSQAITYTEDMLVAAPGNDYTLKSLPSPTVAEAELHLAAQASEAVSHALLRLSPSASKDYRPNEDAEVLIDNEVRPTIALFSIAQGRSLDIQQLHSEADNIPLGFYLRKPATVTLTLSRAAIGSWQGWQLWDAERKKSYPLAEAQTNLDLGMLTTNVGRFYLIKGQTTGSEGIAGTLPSIYCYREGDSHIVVRSTGTLPERCELYSADGKRIDHAAGSSTQYRLRATTGVNIVKVYLANQDVQTFKVTCY